MKLAFDATDWRGFQVLAWTATFLTLAGVATEALGLKYVQEVEWPTDLFATAALRRPAGIDVAIVGSSRSHYGFAPTAIDACLSARLNRPTQTVSSNRLAASTYATDIVARDLFSGERAPRVLVIEVAPESLNANHFELDYNVASSADVRDVPECVAAAVSGPPALAACARPLVRGVENLAFFLHRPLTEHDHVTWMALFAGGGQYCFGTPACEARNAEYDQRHAGRWQTRIERVLPKVRAERFVDYQVGSGLPSAHFVAMLDRARADGVTPLVVNLPVSATYQAEVPVEAYAAYLAWVAPTTAAHGGRFLNLNMPDWQERPEYLDPDHLNGKGALRLSQRLCDEVADSLH
ncbi:hypothetical protein LBMAG42_44500 [Deltaproteobacteria bacterium]|nr:hypothetical protein LBMAG42_44500 [Deltaproteobacteria bacterium]